ncbi:MAG: Holliday junction branch migration protein RuvA [Lachnospiraceae bacterium]|nr:Holliday junction branch migration protein RuvA [Lachnospiraceae bacterium]
MYAYLKGTVVWKTADRIVVEVSGVGYNVNVSPGRIYDFPEYGEEVKVYTYTSVREDAINLYGFVTLDELELFKLLISVSGIGPKGGLAMLSVMSVDDIRYAIMTGDAKLLAKAPGVGKKTAERVIIDLKDKVKAQDLEEPITGTALEKTLMEHPKARDAADALVALGYSGKEAEHAVEQALRELEAQSGENEIHSDQILKLALKYF